MYAKSRVLRCLHRSISKCNKNVLTNNVNNVLEHRCLTSNILNVASEKIIESNKIAPLNKFVNRSHTCGELTINNVGEKVDLCGWLQYQRMGKFFILRDAYGTSQCVIPDDKQDLLEISLESVLKIHGTVVPRPKGQENKKMSTGEIEVLVESVEVSNPSDSNFPFPIRSTLVPKENTLMRHRYLALRFPEMQRNLRLRSWVVSKMREYLLQHCGFVEVETPTLFKRTPGGAQEFVVPTRLSEKFYSLVQSPQQLKQLLMVGAVDRYFQVARCYRDEGSRSNRQPEFTQLDVELSFVDNEGVMELTENVIRHSWPSNLQEIRLPFTRIRYEDCMELYGSDKPDLRIPQKIQNVTEIIKQSKLPEIMNLPPDESLHACALVFQGKHTYFTNKLKSTFVDMAKTKFPGSKLIQLKTSGHSWLPKLEELLSGASSASFVEKIGLGENDVLFLTLGRKKDAQNLIGKLRVEFVNAMESSGHKIRSNDFRFLWVTDFPLFETDRDGKNVVSVHHPFTRPHPEDADLLSTDPTKVRGLHYDLVLNGSEVAGGSIRIHEYELQRQIFHLLNIDTREMEYFFDALKYGAPPHGGIAIGLDRYISMLCGTQSIRDVIAFPKTMEGRDTMTGAPANISEEEKKLYHIQTVAKKKH